jgi:hypothetical protein
MSDKSVDFLKSIGAPAGIGGVAYIVASRLDPASVQHLLTAFLFYLLIQVTQNSIRLGTVERMMRTQEGREAASELEREEDS